MAADFKRRKMMLENALAAQEAANAAAASTPSSTLSGVKRPREEPYIAPSHPRRPHSGPDPRAYDTYDAPPIPSKPKTDPRRPSAPAVKGRKPPPRTWGQWFKETFTGARKTYKDVGGVSGIKKEVEGFKDLYKDLKGAYSAIRGTAPVGSGFHDAEDLFEWRDMVGAGFTDEDLCALLDDRKIPAPRGAGFHAAFEHADQLNQWAAARAAAYAGGNIFDDVRNFGQRARDTLQNAGSRARDSLRDAGSRARDKAHELASRVRGSGSMARRDPERIRLGYVARDKAQDPQKRLDAMNALSDYHARGSGGVAGGAYDPYRGQGMAQFLDDSEEEEGDEDELW